MKYVMLVYQNERAAKEATEEQLASSLEEFNRFHEKLMQSGKLVDAQRLRHSDASTTVSVRNGKVMATDGPYAETKEQLGGFYLIEASDLDEAIETAAMVPTARSGYVEIRPVYGAE